MKKDTFSLKLMNNKFVLTSKKKSLFNFKAFKVLVDSIIKKLSFKPY